MGLPFLWFGYVITDNRTGHDKGFWSPLPRFVSNLNRRFGGEWDYWSIGSERYYRTH
jgi:hypothetical protein